MLIFRQATGPCDVIAIVRSDRKKDKFRELLHGLIYNGGDVNASGEHGMTALHYAVLVSLRRGPHITRLSLGISIACAKIYLLVHF